MNMIAGTPDSRLFKADQDLARVRERLAAFWQGEIIDRACIAVTATREQTVPEPEAESEEQAHTDPEFVVRHYNAHFANTYFGGETLPVAWAPGHQQLERRLFLPARAESFPPVDGARARGDGASWSSTCTTWMVLTRRVTSR